MINYVLLNASFQKKYGDAYFIYKSYSMQMISYV